MLIAKHNNSDDKVLRQKVKKIRKVEEKES
jgi:hypothetical protein